MHARRLAASLFAITLIASVMPAAALARPSTHVPLPQDTIETGASIEQMLAETLPDAAAKELRTAVDRAEKVNQAAGRDDLTTRRNTNPEPASGDPESVEPTRDYTADDLVGQTKTWIALDDTGQVDGSVFGYYEKEYRLAAVGDKIEVWVAQGEGQSYNQSTGTYTLPFQDGDCRNDPYDGQRVQITSEQLNGLVAQFDQNMFPLEIAAFRTPPDRNGDNAQFDLYRQFFFPDFEAKPDGYFATEGGADRTVTFIDNVRDDNFYDGGTEQISYIAGFFSSLFNAMFDRNVMTVDAWDWLHRTGANPPDDPSDAICESSPARPYLYEGTFAHEWQHLLQSYIGGETTWMNEGLSDWAQTLTGYVDPSLPITDQEYDSHVQCFYGFLSQQTSSNPNPRENSGPENSLTWWEDQGPGAILCDYGAAYTMIEYLVGQFGTDAATFLHNDPAAGFASVANLAAQAGDGRSATEILHDWAVMVAVDKALDSNRGRIRGGDADRLTTPTLAAEINWDENDAYDTPGAPPNGSDYVRLRDAGGNYLSARDVRSLEFSAATAYEPQPIDWVVDENPPEHEGDPALYSGGEDNIDAAIAYEVAVPTADPTLEFETLYSFEVGYDYGVVQVSTDGGETYTSLANDITTTDTDSEPKIAAELPGINGDSPGWITATFDLSNYAGQDVIVAFRALTDGGVVSPGWWIDDVTVGGTFLTDGSSLVGAQSPSQINPQPIEGWNLVLVSYDSSGRRTVAIAEIDLDDDFTANLDRRLRSRLPGNNDVVAAIITHDEPTATVFEYAPYTLTVNGVVQPGGS